MTPINIKALPATLRWKNDPVGVNVIGDDSFSIRSAPHTDWFVDPKDSTWNLDNAPCAFFTPADDSFIMSAKVKVQFESMFDAGVIQLPLGENVWGKLCFEFSPQGKPMVVSVVTRGKSDDCNSTIINGNEVYLRVAVNREAIAFHYSTDNSFWHMVRYFTLGDHKGIRAGFSSQSPTGEGCNATFCEIKYYAGVLKDHRSGE